MDTNFSSLLNSSRNANLSTEVFSYSPTNESSSTTAFHFFPNYSITTPSSPSDGLIRNDLFASSSDSIPGMEIEEEINFMKNGIQNYYESAEEQYSTPFLIILVNFFLCAFLMIVIGIAVYPAVKKYCDTTFTSSSSGNVNEGLNWIEDTDEVVSVNPAVNITNAINPTYGDSSFALLNNNQDESLAAQRENSLRRESFDFEMLTEVNVSA